MGDSTPGPTYTWHDGEDTRTVTLEGSPTVQPPRGAQPDGEVARDTGDGPAIARQQQASDTPPVFRNEAGERMTLPGGVLLALDSGWGQARIDQFFADNAISAHRVSRHGFATNGFLIATSPGFPSLELANTLAVLEGVILASPNWQREERRR